MKTNKILNEWIKDDKLDPLRQEDKKPFMSILEFCPNINEVDDAAKKVLTRRYLLAHRKYIKKQNFHINKVLEIEQDGIKSAALAALEDVKSENRLRVSRGEKPLPLPKLPESMRVNRYTEPIKINTKWSPFE